MPDRSEPGHVGDPRSATAEKGEVLFQCFSEEVVKLLERVIAWDGVSWEG
jgi:creatinine amidohydrolase